MVQRQLVSLDAGYALQAEIWTAVANARRRAAEWGRAQKALDTAKRLLQEGIGNPRLEADLLSITASTLADQGQIPKALEALGKCSTIYENLSEWALLARALVKMANVLEPSEPARGLVVLDRAVPLIPIEDSLLRLFAEMLRVDCLINLQRPNEALQVFRRYSHLLTASPRMRPRLRGRFTTARLLDALGFERQAEPVYDEVIAGDIEHELYKDAFLDLLYLYGRHMKAGDLEKAVRVCQKALTDPTLAAAAHEQIRDLWTQLLEAANHQAISQERLKDLRVYFSVHWKHPAATPPVVVGR
jgi:tetratricopeptide (TPR) repeat protein